MPVCSGGLVGGLGTGTGGEDGARGLSGEVAATATVLLSDDLWGLWPARIGIYRTIRQSEYYEKLWAGLSGLQCAAMNITLHHYTLHCSILFKLLQIGKPTIGMREPVVSVPTELDVSRSLPTTTAGKSPPRESDPMPGECDPFPWVET